YLGTNWYSGSGDNGGVHINSGVQNFWFYVLSVGKSGTNDLGNSYNVTGIGMDKAAAIAYRNLTVYLNSNSQYSDARNGAIQA
ncbi:MAG TPA: peptidase M4 thermolysin, partial [Aequorivita sp.]|nr:peptidase M4 thermolysin [Aequorivita sp.]